jgi:hypothetical protein
MASGNFGQIREKITNSSCECCGSEKWDVIEGSPDLGAPAIRFSSPQGEAADNARRVQTVLTICQNCSYVRQFAVRRSPAPSEAALEGRRPS